MLFSCFVLLLFFPFFLLFFIASHFFYLFVYRWSKFRISPLLCSYSSHAVLRFTIILSLYLQKNIFGFITKIMITFQTQKKKWEITHLTWHQILWLMVNTSRHESFVWNVYIHKVASYLHTQSIKYGSVKKEKNERKRICQLAFGRVRHKEFPLTFWPGSECSLSIQCLMFIASACE